MVTQRRRSHQPFPRRRGGRCQQLRYGVVLDGGLVSIDPGGWLSFDALQRRLVTGTAKIAALVKQAPALYVAFDLLAHSGVDLRTQRWQVRRNRLDKLASGWRPPLQRPA